MDQLTLRNNHFSAVIEPAIGGSIRSLDWRGRPIFYPRNTSRVIDGGMFCMVPFSNRIAGSKFNFDGREIALAPNHPYDQAEMVLHGQGWVSAWAVTATDDASAQLQFTGGGGEWPWRYTATQEIELRDDHASFSLTIANIGPQPMPAGMGFHPFFPCNYTTHYIGLHRGEWATDDDRLPIALNMRRDAIDWWHGAAVMNRNIDTAYVGRKGPLIIEWRDAQFGVEITPSANLPFTTVYTPPASPFFCVEPVSHSTNAINRALAEEIKVIEPGEDWQGEMIITPMLL